MDDNEKTNESSSRIKQFEATPYAVGNSHVLTIPSYNVKAGLVVPGKKYRIMMEEIPEEKNSIDEVDSNAEHGNNNRQD